MFVDADEFGTTATYLPTAGGSTPIVGILDTAASRGFEDPGIASSSPRFTCRSADLPAGARKGDTLSVGAIAYSVQVIDQDGTGMAAITLEEAD